MDLNKAVAHRNDPAWIIELWLRIHQGDPVPEQYKHLSETVTNLTLKALATQIKDAGIRENVQKALAPLATH